jgi:hypothetical protein
MKKKEGGGPYTNKEKEGSNYPSAFHSERKKRQMLSKTKE